MKATIPDLLTSLMPEGKPSRLLGAAIGVGVLVGLAVAVLDYLAIEVVLHAVVELPLAAQIAMPLIGLLITTAILKTIGRGCTPSPIDEPR